jgi:hypothetical protein
MFYRLSHMYERAISNQWFEPMAPALKAADAGPHLALGG